MCFMRGRTDQSQVHEREGVCPADSDHSLSQLSMTCSRSATAPIGHGIHLRLQR